MEIVAVPRLLTQIRPSGATATLRGEVPVPRAISAVRVLLCVSMTLTESLSGLTVQMRLGLPLRTSMVMGVDEVGFDAVAAVDTACTKVLGVIMPPESLAFSVTTQAPALAKVCVMLEFELNGVTVPSQNSQL